MRELVCIVCPKGCTMEIDDSEEALSVTGNGCKRGKDFAISEMTSPMRTICTTVKTAFPEAPVLPVRVSQEIPKDKIFDVMYAISEVTVTERVQRGDAVLKNVLGLGADIIVTSNMLMNIGE